MCMFSWVSNFQEEIGIYHPIEVEEKQFSIKEDRWQDWLSKGAKPSPTVKRLVNKNTK